MKQTFILLSFFFFQTISHAQFTGALDATFGANGKVTTSFDRGDDVANGVLVQPDGKILAAGHSTTDTLYLGPFSTSPKMALARYNPNGTLDNSFGTNGKVVTAVGSTGEIKAIALQTDGKIVAVGWLADSAYLNFYGLVRYQSNGQLDKDFGVDGKVKVSIYPTVVTIQNEGKIVVGGISSIRNVSGGNNVFALSRFNKNGTLDSTFGSVGEVLTDINPQKNDYVTGISLQNDGKIVVCGTSKFYWDNGEDVIDPAEMLVVRYNSSGILDSSFAMNGIFIFEDAEACAVKTLNNGKILVGGNGYFSRNNNFKIFRLNNNGAIDATFNFDVPTRGTATDMTLQNDGKIILAGYSYDNDKSNFTLFRCNSEGVLDNTFGTNGKIITPPVLLFERYSKIALQADGKLVACGSSKNYGQFNFNLMRYNNALVSTGKGQLTADKNAYFVYPNPTNNALTIDFKALKTSDIDVKLVDMQGRVVLQKNYSKVAANASLNIDIQDFTAGLYFLQLTSAETKWAQLVSKY
jgi:uncharacterized delta-60 repeat protein